MGSTTPLQLPIIDFCRSDDLKPGTSEWDSVRSQVWKAISENGCFKALFNIISVENQKALLCVLEELFDLPLPTKSRYVSEIPFHSYFGGMSVPPNESFGIQDPLTLKNCDDFCNILWPEGNPSLRKPIQYFSKRVSELEKIIRRMILESLSLDKYLDEHMNSTSYCLRVTKYEGLQNTERKHGLRPHKDKNLITILYQNHVDGLEIRTKDGEQVRVNLAPNHSFFVIIGESFNAWTNGRLHSPHHGVRIMADEARYSAGLFSEFKAGYMVKAPEELVDEEHRLLFKPFDYIEFLKFLKTSGPQISDSALKIYCGV